MNVLQKGVEKCKHTNILWIIPNRQDYSRSPTSLDHQGPLMGYSHQLPTPCRPGVFRSQETEV